MLGKLVALILLSSAAHFQPTQVPQHLSLTVTEVGASVSLICPVAENEGKFFQWYKQRHGYMPQKMVAGILSVVTVEKEFKEPRFTITKGENMYLFNIGNVSKADEAIYFCHNGSAYEQDVANATFLAVKDHSQKTNVCVKQSPKTESIHLGGSVTVECSLHSKNKDNVVQCPDEHSVYWFRSGSHGFNPGVVYTQTNTNDELRERSCVYSMSRIVQNSSDAGTYYCAVVTCGQILFGEGTNVEIRPDSGLMVLVLGALLACCVVLNGAFIIHLLRRRDCDHTKEEINALQHYETYRPASDGSSDLGDAVEPVNYAALNFSTKNGKRMKLKVDPGEECFYSAVEYTRTQPYMQNQSTL